MINEPPSATNQWKERSTTDFDFHKIKMDGIARTHEDIEAQIADIQSKKKELAASQPNEKGVGLLESGYYDSEFYDDGGDKRKRYEGYMTSIAANDDADDDDDDGLPITKRTTYTAPKSILKDVIKQGEKEEQDPFADRRRPTIADREDEYRQKRRRFVISPERADPFADGHGRLS